jgi:cation:H+ antiporter
MHLKINYTWSLNMLTNVIFFGLGIVALVVGAQALVQGASKFALSMGLSPLVVGLTVVAFGTSAPEMAVSTGAVLSGQVDLAVGNVVGSNIFNILFILGASALIIPLSVHVQIIRQEIPIMLGSGLLLLSMGLDQKISMFEAGIMLALLFAYTGFLVVQSRKETASNDYDKELTPSAPNTWDSRWYTQLLLIVVGLGLLVLGSSWLVDSSVAFAKALGVSDLIIGLTIVAAGTSLPEVAASIAAALKGERDMAVGNVIGSCTFNLLGCVGVSGLAAGSAGLVLPTAVLNFDLWVMIATFLACLPIFLTGREIARWEGAVFLLYYVAYVCYLVLNAQESSVLQTYSSVMLSLVMPITIIGFVVMMIKNNKVPSV